MEYNVAAKIDSDMYHQINIGLTSKKPKQNAAPSIFERIDDAIGLNALKKGIKKYSGLDYICDKITDAVDDGDDKNLSLGERLWEGVKGAGKAIENFVGSQGIAFMGILALGSFLAKKAGAGKLFSALTKGYFLYEGASLTITGTRDFINSETKDEAKNAASDAVTGGIMLYGTIKGIKKDIKNYREEKIIKSIENAQDWNKLRELRGQMKKMPNDIKELYVKREMQLRTELSPEARGVVNWNIKTHMSITEQALEGNENLSNVQKRYLARASELPDLDPMELEDVNSAHFYDVLHKDPSYGTKDDARNNALSRFLMHTEKAKQHAKAGETDAFLKSAGYAVHYLQDGGTPPHTEHGNYLHKLYRIPMHCAFEKGKKIGTTPRLPILKENYTPEEIPFSSIEMLFHNTALYSVQPENHVSYLNVKSWPEIQQRCYDRGVNVSKAYLDYILQFMPKSQPKAE